MKKHCHPNYHHTTYNCSCGNNFASRSTAETSTVDVETCNACHPHYTGKKKAFSKNSRAARFKQRYAKFDK